MRERESGPSDRLKKEPPCELAVRGSFSFASSVKRKRKENWYQCYLAKWSVFELLEKCDEELAEKCRQGGCQKCLPGEGRLHRSDSKRKPRGGTEDAKKGETGRESFWCAQEGCRQRHPPPQVPRNCPLLVRSAFANSAAARGAALGMPLARGTAAAAQWSAVAEVSLQH